MKKLQKKPPKFPFAYYNEIDAQKAAWLRELIKRNVVADGIVDERSIAAIQPEDLKKDFTQCHFFAGIGVWSYALRTLAGWPDDRPVWTGSCPCPSFSAAGKGAGFDDPRHLWPHWARLIRECKPATAFGEQADDAIGFGWLDLVQTDLERENYAVGKAVLGACSVGAPHIRQRLYFVAQSVHAERRSIDEHRKDGCDGANGGRQETHSIAGTRGEVCDVAHTDSERCGETRSAASGRGLGGNGASGNVADAIEDGCGARGRDDSQYDGSVTATSFPSGIVANADGRGFAMHRAPQREAGHVERCGQGHVDDSENARLERFSGNGAHGNQSGWFAERQNGSAGNPSHVNGFWRNADWILRKRWNSPNSEWCPTEPGSFPLAHGVAFRVLRLRGYGDAICAPLAAEFIKAYVETTI